MRKHRTFLVAATIAIGSLLGVATSAAIASFQDADEPVSLEGVDSISITGAGRAMITIGSPAELTISGPQEAIDQLEVQVVEDELVIEPAVGSDFSAGADQELIFEITVSSLEDIRLNGAISLEVSSVQGDELDIRLEGAATATVSDVQLAELDAELRGAALLAITGSTIELDVDGREASTFEGSGLVAGSADVEARDAARVTVNVTGALEAEARAAAIIEYVGEPQETDFEMRDAGTIGPFTGTPVAGASPAAIEVDQAAGNEVTMAGRVFSPPTLEIAVGETVTWINDDDADHTVSSSGGPFESGELAPGATFSHTFESAGEFPYFCAIHPEMQGTIVVLVG